MDINIATDKKQATTLIELGLDQNTADMSWYSDLTGDHLIPRPYRVLKKELDELRCSGPIEGKVSPAWSLTAMLMMLPPRINADIPPDRRKDFFGESKFPAQMGMERDMEDFILYYATDKDYDPFVASNQNIMTLVFDTLVWLLENEHILKMCR